MRRSMLATLCAVSLLVMPGPAPAASGPRLSYSKAKRSIQIKADRFARERTRITSMFRLGETIYSGRAEWDRVNPTGCAGCGYDPVTGNFYDEPRTESCSVSLEARVLRSGRVRVSTDSFACY
jgi:hypothetical protein